MTILSIIVAVCVLLFALWLVRTYLPAPWQAPILALIVLVALFLIANVFAPGLLHTRVGR